MRVRPDYGPLEKIPQGIAVFCIGAQNADADIHVRVFAPHAGVAEDPVTGSANGCIGVVHREVRRAAGARWRSALRRRAGHRDGPARARLRPRDRWRRRPARARRRPRRDGAARRTAAAVAWPSPPRSCSPHRTRRSTARQSRCCPGTDDETLIEFEMRQLRAAGVDVIEVVLGAHADAIIPLVAADDVEPIVDDGWRAGEASWLRVGAAAVPRDTTRALIVHAGRPRPAALYRALIETPVRRGHSHHPGHDGRCRGLADRGRQRRAGGGAQPERAAGGAARAASRGDDPRRTRTGARGSAERRRSGGVAGATWSRGLRSGDRLGQQALEQLVAQQASARRETQVRRRSFEQAVADELIDHRRRRRASTSSP